jgi:hypothetical protein
MTFVSKAIFLSKKHKKPRACHKKPRQGLSIFASVIPLRAFPITAVQAAGFAGEMLHDDWSHDWKYFFRKYVD